MLVEVAEKCSKLIALKFATRNVSAPKAVNKTKMYGNLLLTYLAASCTILVSDCTSKLWKVRVPKMEDRYVYSFVHSTHLKLFYWTSLFEGWNSQKNIAFHVILWTR